MPQTHPLQLADILAMKSSLTAPEFSACAAAISDDDAEVARHMGNNRATVHRWKKGTRTVTGPAAVLAQTLAAMAAREAEAEAAEIRRIERLREKEAGQ